jgi:hypothetical protein
MMRSSSRLVALALSVGCPASASAQQVPDTLFRPVVGTPRFAPGRGPVVLIDGGHANFHTADGRFRPFARLIERDGFRVRALSGELTDSALAGVGVLVIANALGPDPVVYAFKTREIRALRTWVERGGALLLIADHMPFPAAVRDLGEAFELSLVNGFASADTGLPGPIVFSRARGTLAEAPLDGAADDPIDSVASFVGSAFPADGLIPLLLLGPGAVVYLPDIPWEFDNQTPRKPAAGWTQGGVKRMGKGRIAVFGEAAMFTAQLAGPARTPVGMNAPEAGQNAQFVLHLMRWLAGPP